MPSGRNPLGNEIVPANASASAAASCGESVARARTARPDKLIRFDIDILQLETAVAPGCAGARRIHNCSTEIDGRVERERRYETGRGCSAGEAARSVGGCRGTSGT